MRCTITRLANQENVHYLEVSILEFLIHNLLNDMLKNGQKQYEL